jgi:hypothetical protein
MRCVERALKRPADRKSESRRLFRQIADRNQAGRWAGWGAGVEGVNEPEGRLEDRKEDPQLRARGGTHPGEVEALRVEIVVPDVEERQQLGGPIERNWYSTLKTKN